MTIWTFYKVILVGNVLLYSALLLRNSIIDDQNDRKRNH